MRIVVTAGGFDPLHVGHLRHLQQAKGLGDKHIVIINSDDCMVGKKGYCFMTATERAEILGGLNCVDEVWFTGDVTVSYALKEVYEQFPHDTIRFAKGGDRTPDNMPQDEIDVCSAYNIEIVYGVGAQIQSSSKLVENAKS